MDPRANIEEQRELAYKLANDEGTPEDAARLAELVLALDEWRQGGGFDPYVEGWEETPTPAQGRTIARLMRNAERATITNRPFDLPDNYVMVVVSSRTSEITYGIDRDGQASS